MVASILSSAISILKWRYFILIFLLLGSSLGVVYTSHLCRHFVIKLSTLVAKAEDLQVEYHQLVLEYASLASYYRIEEITTNQFGMHHPSDKETIKIIDED